MDPPIKQGQTRYPFLVLQFDKDEEMSVHLNISEEDLEKEYENKLQAEMSGPTYEVISRVFKSLIKRKITVPGTFMGASGRVLKAFLQNITLVAFVYDNHVSHFRPKFRRNLPDLLILD